MLKNLIFLYFSRLNASFHLNMDGKIAFLKKLIPAWNAFSSAWYVISAQVGTEESRQIQKVLLTLVSATSAICGQGTDMQHPVLTLKRL